MVRCVSSRATRKHDVTIIRVVRYWGRSCLVNRPSILAWTPHFAIPKREPVRSRSTSLPVPTTPSARCNKMVFWVVRRCFPHCVVPATITPSVQTLASRMWTEFACPWEQRVRFVESAATTASVLRTILVRVRGRKDPMYRPQSRRTRPFVCPTMHFAHVICPGCHSNCGPSASRATNLASVKVLEAVQ